MSPLFPSLKYVACVSQLSYWRIRQKHEPQGIVGLPVSKSESTKGRSSKRHFTTSIPGLHDKTSIFPPCGLYPVRLTEMRGGGGEEEPASHAGF